MKDTGRSFVLRPGLLAALQLESRSSMAVSTGCSSTALFSMSSANDIVSILRTLRCFVG